jgi:hypothetical protein
MVTDSSNHLLDVYNYDRVEPVGKGLYKVAIGGAEALIDEADNNLTGFRKIKILNVFDNIALFYENHHYGVLTLKGDVLVEPGYDSILVRDDFFLVKSSRESKNGWLLLNRGGKQLSSKAYLQMKPIGRRFFAVKSGKHWGALNGLGKEVLICKYDRVEKYVNGRFKVNLLGEEGIIDLHGVWVVPPMKKEIDILDDQHYLVRSPYCSYVAEYPKKKRFSADYKL